MDYGDRALSLQPDLVLAYANRGSAKSNLGRHNDAVIDPPPDYDEAIRIQPGLGAYVNRGNV